MPALPERRSADADVVAAVERGDAPGLASLLDGRANPNARRQDPRNWRWTALHVAAISGRVDLVTLLCDRGADLDAVAFYEEAVDKRLVEGSCTPLLVAIRAGEAEVARLLIARGANPRFTDPAFGESALIAAARLGQLDVIDALIERAAPDRHELQRAVNEARLSRQTAAVQRLEELC